MTSTRSIPLLIPTKLAPPPPQSTWIERGRLLDQLRLALGSRLTLVIAPAGYGKTTLMVQLLRDANRSKDPARERHSLSPPHRFAWLTLDEFDQDALRFMIYIAGAVEHAVPAALSVTAPLLRTSSPPPFYAIIEALLVDLAALPHGLTLVLDDYHLITSEAIHHAVNYLLRHLPASCRLVVLGRVDPPLALARLRAEHQLAELRLTSLRFTTDEAAALIAQLLDRTPEVALVNTLHNESEGWAIALQLGALTRRNPEPVASSHQLAMAEFADYITEEVLSRQSPSLQRLLQVMAVPEQICAELVAELGAPAVDQGQGWEILQTVVRANLIVPVDAEGRWFRFHHLLRAVLLRQLRSTVQPEALRSLQLRTARWLQAEGLLEEAIRHYLAGDHGNAAAALVEQVLETDLGRSVASLPATYWLNLLPKPLIARRPGLSLLAARIDLFVLDHRAMEQHLAQVDALLATSEAADRLPWPTFSGERALLNGTLHYWQKRPEAALAELTLALQQGVGATISFVLVFMLGRTYVATGRYVEGIQLLRGQPQFAQGLERITEVARLLGLCQLHEMAGQIAELANDGQRFVGLLATLPVDGNLASYGDWALAIAAYERSDLNDATERLLAIRQRKYQTNAGMYACGLAALAMIANLRGASDVAAVYEQELVAFAAEIGTEQPRFQALGYRVWSMLARGELAAALRASNALGPELSFVASTWIALPPPHLLHVRALIAAGDTTSLVQAETILAHALAEAEAFHHTRLLVCTLVHQTVLQLAQHRQIEALASLKRAVELARPAGLVRTFVDCSPTLEPLLRIIAAQTSDRTYVEGVLRMFTLSGSSATASITLPTALAPTVLTSREAEILALLAERWSNREIAAKLVIAENTVRKHTSSIYAKLDVGSRRDAVRVALALGLLPRYS